MVREELAATTIHLACALLAVCFQRALEEEDLIPQLHMLSM